MHLAHRWELAGVQAKAEAVLVRKLSPGTYLQRMYPRSSFRALYQLMAVVVQCENMQSKSTRQAY